MNKISFANLNKKILFQEAQYIDDEISGYDIATWKNYSWLWASVKILKNFEKTEDNHLVKKKDYRVIIRYNPNINYKMRIVFQNKVLNIRDISLHQDERFLNINAISQE